MFYWSLAVWIPLLFLDLWVLWVDEPEEPRPVLQIPCWRISKNSPLQINLLVGWALAVLALVLRWRVAFWDDELSGVAGASSGSTLQNALLAYSADGFFSDASYYLYQATVCTYSSASAVWASDNGQPGAICYPPDPSNPGYPDTSADPCYEADCLATIYPSDYPNKAKCLLEGMFWGENTTTCGQVGWCPSTVLSPDGNYVGRAVCSYCLAFERAQNGWTDPATAYCPTAILTPGQVDPTTNSWTCAVVCPGAATKLTKQGAQSGVTTFDLALVWCIVRWARGVARASRSLLQS